MTDTPLPPRTADSVDWILDQWRRERPDLTLLPMGLIGRLKRCTLLIQRRVDEVFSRYGITTWEFDVLATLRRAGAPYCLAPTALFSALMVTSGTMTHRLQRLEAAGLVRRLANPDDARSLLVQLTDQGFALIDQAVGVHVNNEQDILSVLPPPLVAELDDILSRLLTGLEQAGENHPK